MQVVYSFALAILSTYSIQTNISNLCSEVSSIASTESRKSSISTKSETIPQGYARFMHGSKAF